MKQTENKQHFAGSEAGFVVRMAGGIAIALSVCWLCGENGRWYSNRSGVRRLCGENGRWYSKHSGCVQAVW